MTSITDRFFHPRRGVTLVDFGSTLEALCLRSLLEAMGAQVTIYFVGAPQDLFAVLNQHDSPPDCLVLCRHGAEDGPVLGEYGAGIDTSRLLGRHLPARSLDGVIALPGTVVLSTACLSGSDAFGKAFIAGGVSLYAAPADQPDGTDVLLFAHQFFHALLVKRMAPISAVHDASRGCLEPEMFRVFSSGRAAKHPKELTA